MKTKITQAVIGGIVSHHRNDISNVYGPLYGNAKNESCSHAFHDDERPGFSWLDHAFHDRDNLRLNVRVLVAAFTE